MIKSTRIEKIVKHFDNYPHAIERLAFGVVTVLVIIIIIAYGYIFS